MAQERDPQKPPAAWPLIRSASETALGARNSCSIASSSLEEAADVLAVDPEADDAARAVDLVDRVGRDEPAAAREEPRLHREGVRHVRRRAVHRALDLADQATLAVGDDVPGGAAEVDGESTHCPDGIPALRRNS